MFEAVSVDATAYLMSAWRGEVNLLDLGKPEYRPFTETRRSAAAAAAQIAERGRSSRRSRRWPGSASDEAS